jgi:hypothetical protein
MSTNRRGPARLKIVLQQADTVGTIKTPEATLLQNRRRTHDYFRDLVCLHSKKLIKCIFKLLWEFVQKKNFREKKLRVMMAKSQTVSVIAQEERRYRRKIAWLEEENERLRRIVYSCFPNFLRKLPREIFQHVRSFQDNRPKRPLIVRLKDMHVIVTRNGDLFDVHFRSLVTAKVAGSQLLAGNVSETNLLSVFAGCRCHWGPRQFSDLEMLLSPAVVCALGMVRLESKTPCLPEDKIQKQSWVKKTQTAVQEYRTMLCASKAN